MTGHYDKTYEQVHAGLFWAQGKASEHPCFGCGGVANDWAYMHNCPDELISPTGAPYSENFSRYEPMCKSCHLIQEHAMNPTHKANRSEWARRAGEATKQRALEDPEFAARRLQHLKAAAKKSGDLARGKVITDPVRLENIRKAQVKRCKTEPRRKCAECDLVTVARCLGMHQKHTGHVGYEELPVNGSSVEIRN